MIFAISRANSTACPISAQESESPKAQSSRETDLSTARPWDKRVLDSPLPTYVPPIKLPSITGQGVPSDATELQTFQKFPTKRVVDTIVAATNSYAERKKAAEEHTVRARPWKNTTFAEVIRYIGCLVYMGMHIERQHESYWQDSHRLGRFLSKGRYDQIHRYFTLRDSCIHPKRPEDE